MNFYEPHIGQAVVRVLEALGYDVIVPSTRCCGRPLISQGLLRDAAALAETNVAILAPYAERHVPIVVSEPSCLSTMWDEWPQLVRTPAARNVAACAVAVETLVAAAIRRDRAAMRPEQYSGLHDACREGEPAGEPRLARGLALPSAGLANVHLGDIGRSFLYHGHCHQKALLGTADAMELLTACSAGRAREINSGCCGMAGAFGHEVEHYDAAQAIGEQRLFPAIRARGDADVVASGFSCRQHIAHHTGVTARHVIEIVADALAPPSD